MSSPAPTAAAPAVAAADSDNARPNLLKNPIIEQLPTTTAVNPRDNLYYVASPVMPQEGRDGGDLPGWHIHTRPGCSVGGQQFLDVIKQTGPQNNDVARFPEEFRKEFPDWRRANFFEANGQRVYSGIWQEIPTEDGAEYEVSYWAGKSPWTGESKHWANGRVEVLDSYDKVIEDQTWHVDNKGMQDPLGAYNPNWQRHAFTFTAQGPTAVVRFLEDGAHDGETTQCDPGYHGGASYAGMAVRRTAPARQYAISGTRPESSSERPLTAPRDQAFGEFAVRILDSANQPLSAQRVTLELEPRATGSYFVSGDRTSQTYSAQTDVKGWLTVPAGALQAGAVDGPMQLYVRLNGARLNGQVNLVVGASAARFSVSAPPAWDLRPTPAGSVGYPGVRVRAEDVGEVPRQRVSVSLPPDRGLEFVAERNDRYQLTVLGAGQDTAYYPGTLAGQTLTFEDVGLALAGKGSVSTLWVAVQATGHASPGDTYLTFRVGDREPVSTLFRVAAP
ncbi:hypothetical protein [Streptomyces sp. CA-132043]|uniref:hypothetical protein n=1 Tax=Streptomyces sp. CA-132043 TaxID=3240048 RepID=UPI003D8B7A17